MIRHCYPKHTGRLGFGAFLSAPLTGLRSACGQCGLPFSLWLFDLKKLFSPVDLGGANMSLLPRISRRCLFPTLAYSTADKLHRQSEGRRQDIIAQQIQTEQSCFHEAREGPGGRLMTFPSPFLYCLPLLLFSDSSLVCIC